MVREDVKRSYWAAVVGSGGLAEAICEHLCKLGFGIILCARSESRAYRLQVCACVREILNVAERLCEAEFCKIDVVNVTRSPCRVGFNGKGKLK